MEQILKRYNKTEKKVNNFKNYSQNQVSNSRANLQD